MSRWSGCFTSQQLSKRFRARWWDGECELVHGNTVSYCQSVYLPVGNLTGQQLPQQHTETATRDTGRSHTKKMLRCFHVIITEASPFKLYQLMKARRCWWKPLENSSNWILCQTIIKLNHQWMTVQNYRISEHMNTFNHKKKSSPSYLKSGNKVE